MKILLANIGNRNLKYKGDTFDLKLNKNFKNWSKELLDNFEENEKDLEINIIDDLLKVNSYDAIIIFPTNQLTESHQHQDTIYEAQILKKLIENEYGILVDIENEVNCKVTDNDHLLLFYREQIRKIKEKYQGEIFIEVCDAGGTAQMKSSLKIVLEFFLSEAEYKVTYVNPDGNIELVPQVQYRKIIEEQQIITLAKGGNFVAAQNYADKNNLNLINSLCQIGNLRLNHIWNNAQQLVKKEWKNTEQYKFLNDFRIGDTSTKYQNFEDSFPKKHAFFLICERFTIAEYHFLQKDFTALTLSFSVFIETFVNEYFKYNTDFDLVGNYQSASISLLKEVKSYEIEVLNYFNNDVRSGLPLNLIYLKHNCLNEHVLEILEHFILVNSVTSKNANRMGIDALRNEVAHKGKGITKEEFFNNAPSFGHIMIEVKKLLGVTALNSFIALAKLIEEELKM